MSRVQTWHKLAVGGASAAVMAMAIAGHFEGRKHVAYRDIGGVWTLCDGHTRGVHAGMKATDAQCDAWRAEDMHAAESVVKSCYPTIPDARVQAALDDLAFNEGHGKSGVKDGVCVLKSGRLPTILRRALAGDWAGVCNGIDAWNKAQGSVIPGLVRRRAAERELCLEGTK